MKKNNGLITLSAETIHKLAMELAKSRRMGSPSMAAKDDYGLTRKSAALTETDVLRIIRKERELTHIRNSYLSEASGDVREAKHRSLTVENVREESHKFWAGQYALAVARPLNSFGKEGERIPDVFDLHGGAVTAGFPAYDPASSAVIAGGAESCGAHLLNFGDKVVSHESSPSDVGSADGPVDASKDTVGDAADTTGSPSGVSADPSGGAA